MEARFLSDGEQSHMERNQNKHCGIILWLEALVGT